MGSAAVLCNLITGCLERRVTEPEDLGGGRGRRTALGPSPCVGVHQLCWVWRLVPAPTHPVQAWEGERSLGKPARSSPPSGPPLGLAPHRHPAQVGRSPGPGGDWRRQEEYSVSHSHMVHSRPVLLHCPGARVLQQGAEDKNQTKYSPPVHQMLGVLGER